MLFFLSIIKSRLMICNMCGKYAKRKSLYALSLTRVLHFLQAS